MERAASGESDASSGSMIRLKIDSSVLGSDSVAMP
jgi:hypothetical protein